MSYHLASPGQLIIDDLNIRRERTLSLATVMAPSDE